MTAPAKTAPDLVEALVTHFPPGAGEPIREGDRLPADDPRVLHAPSKFVPADMPDEDKRRVLLERRFARIDRRGEPRAPKSGPPVGVPFDRLGAVTARHRFVTPEGIDVRTGTVFDASDELPRRFAHLFAPVPAPQAPSRAPGPGIPFDLGRGN